MKKLKFFESAYPRKQNYSKKDYFTCEISEDKTEYRFIGFEITSADIRDKLGENMVSKQKFFNNAPTVKKVMVYADTFTLKENVWIPEADIKIHVKTLNVNNYSIISSPLPHQKAINRKLVDRNSTENGLDGRNAGNLDVSYEQVKGNGGFKANGTDGVWVYVPKVTIAHPTYKKSIKFHILEGCDPKSLTMTYTEKELHNTKVVSVDYNTVSRRIAMKSNWCKTRKKFDDDVIWTGGSDKPDYPSSISDGKDSKRLTYTLYKPGAGGDAGKVSVNYGKHSSLTTNQSKSGKTGYYLPRNDSDHYTCEKGSDGRCTHVTFNYIYYYHLFIHAESSRTGVLSSKAKWGNSYYVPSPNDTYKFTSKVLLGAPNKNGDFESQINNNKNFNLHPETAIIHVAYLKDQFSVFYRKTTSEKTALATESLALLSEYIKISDHYDFSDQDDLKSRFYTAKSEIIALSEMKIKNLDEFNNPPGYRPLLSMVSTLSYIDKNLEDDLYLYVFADKAARKEANIKKLKEELPNMIKKLYKVNDTLSLELEEVNKSINKLSSDAKECKDKTQKINDKLKSLKAKYEEEATEEQKKQMWYKSGLKFCALAANVIPYGQPILGQVVGNTLNGIANQIGEGDTVDPGKVIDKIDMTGIMEKMGEKKMGKRYPQSAGDYELELNSLMETKEVTKLTINALVDDHKAELEKYKKKVNETKKRWVEAGSGLKDIVANQMSYSVSKDKINSTLSKMMNNSADAQELFSELRVQLSLKQEIFASFQDNAQKALDINYKVLVNSDQIKYLNYLSLTEVNYMPKLANAMKQMRASARKRLNWIEYQLVKVYEYSQLKPYGADSALASNEVLDKVYSRIPKDTSTKDIVNKLKPVFSEQIRGMSNNVLTDLSLGHKQDPKRTTTSGHKYGRYVMLDKDNRPDLFEKINSSTATMTIDLQQDLIGTVIQADQENARIIDISIDEAKFDKLLPKGAESVQVKIELGRKGILKKENDFYIFNTEKGDSVPDTWTWTIKNLSGNKNEITNASELSDNYKSLLKFILGKEGSSKPGENENIFTLPPAWNTLKISLTYPGYELQELPKLESLALSLRLDYQEIATDSNSKILDVKLKNAPEGTKFTVKSHDESVCYDNYYDIFKSNKQITVDLEEILCDIDTEGYVFDRWIMIPNLLDKESIRNKKITFSSSQNIRLTALFNKVNAMPTLIAGEEKEYVLYPEASEEKSPIITVFSTNEFKILDEDYKDGFARVIYGMQEAFVKLN